jgi:hypothetical protein
MKENRSILGRNLEAQRPIKPNSPADAPASWRRTKMVATIRMPKSKVRDSEARAQAHMVLFLCPTLSSQSFSASGSLRAVELGAAPLARWPVRINMTRNCLRL